MINNVSKDAWKSIVLPHSQGESIDFLRSPWGRGKRRTGAKRSSTKSKSMEFYVRFLTLIKKNYQTTNIPGRVYNIFFYLIIPDMVHCHELKYFYIKAKNWFGLTNIFSNTFISFCSSEKKRTKEKGASDVKHEISVYFWGKVLKWRGMPR